MVRSRADRGRRGALSQAEPGGCTGARRSDSDDTTRDTPARVRPGRPRSRARKSTGTRGNAVERHAGTAHRAAWQFHRPRSWESKLSNSGAWDFKVSATGPWYRSRRVLAAAAAVAAVALVVTGVVLFIARFGRRRPGVDARVAEQPHHCVARAVEPGSRAVLRDRSAAATAATAPPPPSADQITVPPTRRYTPPRRSAPSQSDMPEIGVTRTPVTRAPFSATPPPPRTPDRNSSTPGDGRRRRRVGTLVDRQRTVVLNRLR